MPAIQVARTDTFELQRQKINQIGSQVFSITQGGSDLSTGNLKIGDGTIDSPSLAFATDHKLGIYKNINVFEFVSDEKRLLNFSRNSLIFFKDISFRKNILVNSGLAISSSGQNYDPGTYTDIELLGGSGELATVDITVIDFVGSTTTVGEGYDPGSYFGIELVGGNGSGATMSFTVDGLSGQTLNGGSNYEDGFYNDIPAINGSGSGASFNFNIQDGSIGNVTINDIGSGYENGDILNVDPNFDGVGSGSGFQYEIT